jgi:hypothetical protein
MVRSGAAALQGASSSVRALAEQVLASQRKFAEDVLKTTAPMLTGQDDAPARKNGSTAK